MSGGPGPGRVGRMSAGSWAEPSSESAGSRSRRPPRNRKLTALFVVGWLVMFASVIALYAGGQWIYTAHAPVCLPGQSPQNGTCQTVSTYPYTVAVVTPLGLAVLLLGAIYSPIAYADRRWPLRAVAIFALFAMTVGTVVHVYSPPPRLLAGALYVDQPTISTVAFFATLLLAAGATVCVYGLIERPSGLRGPRSRARPLRHTTT